MLAPKQDCQLQIEHSIISLSPKLVSFNILRHHSVGPFLTVHCCFAYDDQLNDQLRKLLNTHLTSRLSYRNKSENEIEARECFLRSVEPYVQWADYLSTDWFVKKIVVKGDRQVEITRESIRAAAIPWWFEGF